MSSLKFGNTEKISQLKAGAEEEDNDNLSIDGNSALSRELKISGLLKRTDVTEKEAEEAMLNQANGMSVSYASKYPTHLKDVLSAAEVGTQKYEGKDNKTAEAVFGRNLFTGIQNCLRVGGVTLILVVLSNYDLSKYASERNETRMKIEQEMLEAKSAMEISSNFPDITKQEDMKIKIKVGEKEQEMYNEHFNHFKAKKIEEWEEKTKQKRQPKKTVTVEKLIESKVAELATEEQQVVEKETVSLSDLDFINSPAYQTFSTAFEREKRKIEVESYREQLKHLEYLDHQRQIHQISKLCVEKCEKQSQTELVMQSVVHAMNTCITIILQKVKSALTKDYPAVQAKLRMRVELPNGEVVMDPMISDNLCAIYFVLYNEYSKPSLVNFCDNLMDLLSLQVSEDVSRDHPEKGVAEVMKHLSAWHHMELYEFMDIDKLFTIVALNMYSRNSDIRVKGILALFEYIHKSEIGEIRMPDPKKMPLFNFLIRWIDEVYGKAKNFSKSNSVQAKGNNNGSNNKPSSFNNKTYGNGSGSGVGPGKSILPYGAEKAYATTTEKAYAEPVGPYSHEVTRSHKLYTTNVNTGDRYLYTATREPCPRCFSAQPKKDQKSDGKKIHEKDKDGTEGYNCYLGICYRCNLCGHRGKFCHQVRASGHMASTADFEET